MPTVPQYTREVKPELKALPYQEYKLTDDMFGVNVARAQGNLGDAIGNVGDSLNNTMLGIAARIEDSNILELRNRHSEYCKQNLTDTENGYLYKTGEDAYGKSQDLIKDYEKYMTDYISKSFVTPRAKKKAMDTYGALRERFNETVTSHDYKSGVELAKNRAELAKNNCMRDAIDYRNDSDKYAQMIQTGFQAIEFQGEMSHWDDAKINFEKANFRAQVIEETLSQYLADGDLKATEFFTNNKKYINPDKIASYAKAVRENELDYTSRTAAEYLITLPPEEAQNRINSVEKIDERNAIEREYNRRISQLEKLQKEKDAQAAEAIMQQVFQMQDNGGSISDIMTKVNAADMSLELKLKILGNLKNMQELEQYGNNWADYNYLRDLATTDHEQFMNEIPAAYNLTKEQYQKIAEMQRKDKDIQYSTEEQLEKIIDKVSTGFNPFTQHDLWRDGNYKREVLQFLNRLERLQGKAFDINHIDEGEIANLIKGLNYKNPDVQNKNIDEVKELWMRAKNKNDMREAVAKGYTSFKAENKREPNETEMYDIVKRGYNWVNTEYKQRGEKKLQDTTTLINNVKSITPKKGETKALTYLADVTIPAIGRKLGVKYTYVDGARYRAGDKGNHGKGLSLDVSMSEHRSDNIRVQSFEEFAAQPHIKSIGTSDAILLKRFRGNSKLKDLTAYDRTHGTNHVNHMHITVDERYGGNEQGK